MLREASKNLFIAFARSLALVNIMWVVFFITLFLLPLKVDLRELGLIPRHLSGLIGVITMHFLHAGFAHLIVNSIGLISVLIPLYLSFNCEFHMPAVIFKICGIGGLLLWLVGRDSYHVGASLLVYGLMTYMLAGAIVHHRERLLLYALLTLSLNSFIFVSGMLPGDPSVSWEGHLCGAIAGILVALGEKHQKQTQLPAEDI